MLVDRVGKRRMFILLTCVCYILCHMAFGFFPSSHDSPSYAALAGLILIGVGFSMYSAIIVPSVPCVVEQRFMGTAFGLLGMFESIALSAFPLISAAIFETYEEEDIDKATSYTSLFFVGITVLAFLFTTIL